MGMVKCRECGKDVSDEAKNCPHCGVAKPAPESKFGLYLKLGFGAVLVISMVRCISDQEDRKSQATAERQRIEASKTPEQRAREEAEKAKKEAAFQSVVSRLRSLKASTKNPNSFELVDAILMADGTLCASYRGTNSFNAVVTEHKAIAKNLKIVEWNHFCGGKSGTDMKYARQAL
jgi:surfactin synthase thioesterase subunit